MDFLKWWWWHVLSESGREDVFVLSSVAAIVIAVVLFVMAHMWFYPWMLCLDSFLVVTVPGGWFYWYFSRQHKTWQELEEEEDDV